MFQTFLRSVAAVTVILLLTATGYCCAAKGWMKADTKAFISRFLLTLAVPSMCVYGLRSNLTNELLGSSLKLLAATFAAETANLVIAFVLARAMKLPRSKSGVFIVMCGMSNAMFIGYTMCVELFGEACVPYVMIFYLANTSFAQTLAMWLIRRSGDKEGNSPRETLRFLLSPTVLAVFVGFALVLLDVHLPDFAMSYLRYMNNCVSPLALVLTGYIIYEIGLGQLRMDRTLTVVMICRFLLSPALIALLCAALDISGLARSVLLIESAMPVMTQTVVAATQFGADEGFAARGVALSTVASFAVIPILMLLL